MSSECGLGRLGAFRQARAEIARVERRLKRYFEAFETGGLSAARCQDRVRSHCGRLEALREQEADPARRLATRRTRGNPNPGVRRTAL